MLDHETRSYWSIMSEEAIWGKRKGQRLQPLQGSQKMQFGQWRALHPNTKVLSTDGIQHSRRNPYDQYFTSAEGFRGLSASDGRLKDKALLYGLHVAGKPWIVAHDRFHGGGVATVGHQRLFLYREAADSPFQGTAAVWLLPGDTLKRTEEDWVLQRGGVGHRFDVATRSFSSALKLQTATGFDTYWYIWSLTNPETQIAGTGS